MWYVRNTYAILAENILKIDPFCGRVYLSAGATPSLRSPTIVQTLP